MGGGTLPGGAAGKTITIYTRRCYKYPCRKEGSWRNTWREERESSHREASGATLSDGEGTCAEGGRRPDTCRIAGPLRIPIRRYSPEVVVVLIVTPEAARVDGRPTLTRVVELDEQRFQARVVAGLSVGRVGHVEDVVMSGFIN